MSTERPAPKAPPLCRHKRTSIGEARIYEYCEDCGAVRNVDQINAFGDAAWHSCDLCRLPPPYS